MQRTAGNAAVRSLLRWNTEAARKSQRERTYSLDGGLRVIAERGTNHEDIVRGVLRESPRDTRFGARAHAILVHWVAEIDGWKGTRLAELARSFPELRELDPSVPEGSNMSRAETLLHSYGGANPAEIGIVGADSGGFGRLEGGLIAALRDRALGNFRAGHHDHALRLLGISLHTIQDFYSHRYPLAERDRPSSARCSGVAEPSCTGPMHILEDDPALGLGRWAAAWQRTREQLELFHDGLGRPEREALAPPSPAPPTMTVPRGARGR
jgi:hypothetical protein